MAPDTVRRPIMPFPRRALLLAVILVATPALAGCNFQQWSKLEGTVNVFIAPQPAAKTQLNDFQKLKIGIVGVSIKQVGVLDTKEFSYGADPKLIDLVASGRSGEKIKVASTSIPIRAVESLTVRIEVELAVDASGHELPSCHPGETVVSKPCVSTPVNGAYRIDQKNIAIPRGGAVDAYFPLAVLYDATSKEYFIQSDPAAFQTVNE
jgi:hypothetical protein